MGVFDEEEPKAAKSRRDTELTLGSGALLGVFFGLAVVCGLSFGLGYSVGHHAGPPPVITAPQPSPDQEPLTANGSIPKPSAADQVPIVPTPQPVDVTQTVASPATPASGAASAPAPVAQNSPPPTTTAGPPPAKSEVHPALQQTAANTPPGQPGESGSVHPALQSAQPLMVEIAAVSNPQDAEVLVTALRQRGYAVTVRRNLTDNLIHVRIGPFATREIANQWRTKLLSDGYNAVVQP